jgi:hypothetical protein
MRGGLDDRMPVLEVGTGVGYLEYALERAWRLEGRGRPGDEDKGSNAGRRDVAGRFTPAIEGSEGSSCLLRGGDESMVIILSE